MGCAVGFSSRFCRSECLPSMKFDECFDEMEKNHPRVVRRNHVKCLHIKSTVTCLWALIVFLVTIRIFLDRTAEGPLGWKKNPSDRYQNQALAQDSGLGAGDSDAIRPGKSIHNGTIGSSIVDELGKERAAAPRAISRATGALHGMGVTFRKGSRAMTELVVAHLDDTTTPAEFRIFLRTLHRSGVTARADVVILFPRVDTDDNLAIVLKEEERSFWRLMLKQQQSTVTSPAIRRKNSMKLKGGNSTPDPANVINSIFIMPNSSISAFKSLGLAIRGPKMASPDGTNNVFLMPNPSTNASTSPVNVLASHDRRLKETTPEEGNSKESLQNDSSPSTEVSSIFGEDSTSLIRAVKSPSPAVDGERTKEAGAKRFRRTFKKPRRNIPTPTEIDVSFFKIPNASSSISPFNLQAFRRSREEGNQGKGRRRGGVIWAINEPSYVHGSGSTYEEMTATVTWGDWGSIVGFEMQDLERGEALTGFIDNPPAQLRRWMCYKMLLGMVRRQYQTVLLTEVSGVFILGDLMSETREGSFGSSIYLVSEDRTWNEAHLAQQKVSMDVKALQNPKDDSTQLPHDQGLSARTGDRKSVELSEMSSQVRHDSSSRRPEEFSFIHGVYGRDVWKKLEEEDRQKAVLGSGIIMGNINSIRALSNAMVMEIVRVAAIVRKNRRPFHDQPLLNYLVLKSSFINRKVSEKILIVSNGASPVHTLPGSKQKSVFRRKEGGVFHALQGLNLQLVGEEIRNLVLDSIRTDICSSPTGFKAYEDCS